MNSATDASESPVHIDFCLERRDLFQASLQMYRSDLFIVPLQEGARQVHLFSFE
jgi:hypothetical protein